MDVSDGEYGELYCPSATEDESVDLNKLQRGNGVGNHHDRGEFFDFSSSSFEHDPVPGPAPEVEPPRPAPSLASGVGVGNLRQFYKNTTAKLRNPEYHQMMDYDQVTQQQQQQHRSRPEQPLIQHCDLNENYNDNQHIQFQQQHQQQHLPPQHQQQHQQAHGLANGSSHGLCLLYTSPSPRD